LKPGGVFAFTTVDSSSWVARFRKSKWRQIHPPTHVSYFSKRSLEILMERHGLELLVARFVGQVRSVDIALYSLFVLIYKKPKIYEWLTEMGLNRGKFYLNTFDTLLMVGRKILR
jgi:hypothetical protein